MSSDAFHLLQDAVESGGSQAGFDFLMKRFKQEKEYHSLFEARLMKQRHELGLPLIEIESLSELPEETQRAYEQAFIEAAREVGNLLLRDGNILRAWPYFRAIGEVKAVAAAIDQFEPQEEEDQIEQIIEIAFLERVNPRRGFELILAQYGVCRAITSFGQYPGREGRQDCIRLLVRTLHGDLRETLKRVIAQQEGQPPETESIEEMTRGRDWLFGENQYYIDASHLASVVRFSADLSDPQNLGLALELARFGERLPSQFQSQGDPPFENLYEDYGAYLRALLGEDVENALGHFRGKLLPARGDEEDNGPAQVMVSLLSRLKRHGEALEVSLKHLRGVDSSELTCPSIPQLCQLAGELEQLSEVAHEQQDLLSFAAARLQVNH